MSVKFTRLEEVNLADAEAKADGIDDKNGGMISLNIDEGPPDPIFIPKWKFWNRPSRYGSRSRYEISQTRRIFCRNGCRKCKCKVNSWRAVVASVLIFSAVVFVSTAISKLVSEPPDDTPVIPTELYNRAVATDVPVCTLMGDTILEQNGTAVDAAITSLLCLGAVHPESSGLGGGGWMVVRHGNGSVYSINFREAAPSEASQNMFHSNNSLSKIGGLSVAIPGELKGMELAHRLFGRLAWADLFQPVITLCKNGFNMTLHTEKALNSTWGILSKDSRFREIYLNENSTLKKAGDWIVRPKLAASLELIAEHGADVLYRGALGESIVRAIHESEVSGILTMDDLASYEALLENPLTIDYYGHRAYSPPVPSGGSLLLFILNVMNGYTSNNNSQSTDLNLTYHRLIESFKYGFALRTDLGDPTCDGCGEIQQNILETQLNMTSGSYGSLVRSFISDETTFNVSHYHPHYSSTSDSGTTHLSVLAQDGQAVSVTSSVNTYFGSKIMTDTGIVLNNEMDDFSSDNITNSFGLRASPANYILPGKRPLSSMCPIILVKSSGRSDGALKPALLTGASGGSRIPTAVAQVVLKYLSMSESLPSAIEARRLHHQLLPNQICPEEGFPVSIQEYLLNRGHVIRCESPGSYAAVQGVGVRGNGTATAHSDSRKLGDPLVD